MEGARSPGLGTLCQVPHTHPHGKPSPLGGACFRGAQASAQEGPGLSGLLLSCRATTACAHGHRLA